MPCMSRGMPSKPAAPEPTLQEAMALIGVTIESTSADWPVFEGDYLKFMGGPGYDLVACDQLEDWLKLQGYYYERTSERSVSKLCNRAVLAIARALGWSNEDIIENAVTPADQAWFEREIAEEGSARTWAAPRVTLSAHYV